MNFTYEKGDEVDKKIIPMREYIEALYILPWTSDKALSEVSIFTDSLVFIYKLSRCNK